MATVGRLDSYFTSLITDLMEIERAPLTRYKEQRDTISIRRGAYIDLKAKLDDLQSAVKALTSASLSNVLSADRKATVTLASAGSSATVLTAATSSGAIAGEYAIHVTQLSRAQRQTSTAQATADQALGKSGTFWLGGSGVAQAAVQTPTSAVSAAGVASLTSGQRELGTGAYVVETRDNEGTLEFRLKDVDGNTVSIADIDGEAGSFTSQWQKVSAGEYNTGRGLTFTLSESASEAISTTINYTAAGVGVAVDAADSLLNIAAEINSANQPVGRDLRATVVGTQLVLTAANTGTAHKMVYTDGVGLGFSGVDSVSAQNALFSVNGIDFAASSSTGLKNIINDVTINLASDAEGQDATLTIDPDLSNARTGIENFVEKFNALQSYLQTKTAITSVNTGDSLSFTRGTLSEDYAFSSLRTELLSRFASNFSNAGAFDNLRDIGLKINDSLQATITNSDLLDSALQNNLTGVQSLLDQVMGDFNRRLEVFTGSSNGYINRAVESFEQQTTELDQTIDKYNLYLTERQANLMQQYGEIQTQLTTLSYTQQIWSTIYNSTINLTT